MSQCACRIAVLCLQICSIATSLLVISHISKNYESTMFLNCFTMIWSCLIFCVVVMCDLKSNKEALKLYMVLNGITCVCSTYSVWNVSSNVVLYSMLLLGSSWLTMIVIIVWDWIYKKSLMQASDERRHLLLDCIVEPQENPQECSVCLENLNENVCKLPACNHRFHRKCIAKWLVDKDTCPMCRTIVQIVETY